MKNDSNMTYLEIQRRLIQIFRFADGKVAWHLPVGRVVVYDGRTWIHAISNASSECTKLKLCMESIEDIKMYTFLNSMYRGRLDKTSNADFSKNIADLSDLDKLIPPIQHLLESKLCT
jgi:hypothetical protein